MQDSIYYHKPGHFREFIRVITDKSISVSKALATFREVKCLPNKFKQMTVHDRYCVSITCPLGMVLDSDINQCVPQNPLPNYKCPNPRITTIMFAIFQPFLG
jgi:hypothetical protein